MKALLIIAISLVFLIAPESKAQSTLTASAKPSEVIASPGDDDQPKERKQQVILVTGVPVCLSARAAMDR
ncbi:MAG: hypothetical protein U5K79_16125 [Cyclobacteriaceae bacterium]|nr:hypothetical protein [Cyclobacteriaceae bacterium]